MPVPNDPIILLSFVNTKLRDEYSSLEAMCGELGICRAELEAKLLLVGYEYNASQNRFC